MQGQNQSLDYYFYSLSNFLAAFGGGMILGKGVNVISSSLIQGDSVLAFFIGTVLGLIFLQLIREEKSEKIAIWFSMLGAATSIILYFIFVNFANVNLLSDNIAIVFFIFLCLRFSFWFYSRVLRVAKTAGTQQRIAWVELGYFAGIIIGLIVWEFLNVEINFAFVLLIDAFLQFLAGVMDIISAKTMVLHSNKSSVNKSSIFLNNNIFLWKLAIALMSLTVGVQVIIFSLAQHVVTQKSSYILASFYLGAFIAASIYKKLKINLCWKQSIHHMRSQPFIFLENKKIKYEINLTYILFLIVFLVAIVLREVSVHDQGIGHNYYILLPLVFVSAFFYEIIALSVIDSIGLDNSNKKDMIIYTYGLMGIGAAVSLWFITVWMSFAFSNLLFLLCACVLFSFWMLRKKIVL